MSNFFAFATKNSWDEDVFQLTTGGILTIVALIVFLIVAALFIHSRKGSHKLSTKQLVFSAVAMALGTVTSMIKLFHLPMGGSITLFSMLTATLAGYFCGPKWGLASGVALGLLNLIIDPVILFPMQVLLDYILAFGCLGLSGFFSKQKYGLYVGYVVAIIGRFICSFLSGFLFFGEYAPDGMNPVWYSFLYNIFYIGGEGVLTLIVLALPPVKNTIYRLKAEHFA